MSFYIKINLFLSSFTYLWCVCVYLCTVICTMPNQNHKICLQYIYYTFLCTEIHDMGRQNKLCLYFIIFFCCVVVVNNVKCIETHIVIIIIIICSFKMIISFLFLYTSLLCSFFRISLASSIVVAYKFFSFYVCTFFSSDI